MGLRNAVPAAAAAAALLLGATGPASAAPAASGVAARATALRQAVDRLGIAAAQASETYDAATAELNRVVVERVAVAAQLDAAGQAADATRGQAGVHARWLYESGGSLGLIASLLDGVAPSDVLDRAQLAGAVLAGDAAARRNADAGAALVVQLAARAQAAAVRQAELERAAAIRRDEITRLLDQTSRLLAGADAAVRRLADAQRTAAQAAAARDFAARLAAARSGAAGASTGPLPAPTAVAARAVAAARTRLGMPYIWGDEGPTSFDCSGLTQWSYAQAGLALPRTAAEQWSAGRQVGLAQLAPGDLLFWATDPTNPATIYHEGMYLGDGQMIVAPRTGEVVRIQAVFATDYAGAVRPVAG